jgi:hypothetical protein
MSTVTAFNEMMTQFMDELVDTFPEESELKKGRATMNIMKVANPRTVVDMFMAATAPYQAKIMAKDESLFSDDIEFPGGIDLKKLWTPDVSDNTKGAIWQYLQTLNILGTTVNAIPQETLTAIEGIADQMAKSGTDPSQVMGGMDMAAIQNVLGGMFGKLG